MPETFETFWMLYAEGFQAPAKKHDSAASAEGEAMRIAAKQNCRVFVLKSSMACVPVPHVQWTQAEDRQTAVV